MRKLAAAAAATLLLIAACSSEDPEAATPPPPEEAPQLPEELPEPDIADLPEVVAEVDGVQITRAEFLDIYEPEFQQVAAASQASGQELDQDELKRQIADVLVDTELMLMEAAERSIEPTEEQVEDAAAELAEDWQLGSADELFTMLEEQGVDPAAARAQFHEQTTVEQLIADESGEFSISEDELREQYDEIAGQAGEDVEVPEFDEVRDVLAEELEREHQNTAAQELLVQLREDAEVTYYLDATTAE